MAYPGMFMDTILAELLSTGSALKIAFRIGVVMTMIHGLWCLLSGEKYGKKSFKDLLNQAPLR